MLILISFEWQKKMEHLKIIKPHCLCFRNFWDMCEMLVATKRQKLGQVEDIYCNVAFLELGLF